MALEYDKGSGWGRWRTFRSKKGGNNEIVAIEYQVHEYGLSLNVLDESYAHNTITTQ